MTEETLNYQSIKNISQKMDSHIENDDSKLISYCNSLQKSKGETPFLTAQLYYTIGTGYFAAYSSGVESEWSSPHIKKAVYYLRKALHEVASHKKEHYIFEDGIKTAYLSTSHLRSKISINLANYLTEQHRHIEALEFYDLAINEKNAFGLTTKARCLIKMSESTYDKNSRFFFYKQAYKLSKIASLPESICTPSEQDIFENLKHQLNHYSTWF